ncbi:hypothetical protein NP233_g9488 [Leucocoprinus birnbaumii]|uniref:Uncharacterized protein n=1 Tax=Leucocoprinus birnbaumii TaxID=56174 RepID=A0AAD5YST4_9AGAR|nr:hypothetical protein NP233_g9488 [Leucocoprinus birnbaumii]
MKSVSPLFPNLQFPFPSFCPLLLVVSATTTPCRQCSQPTQVARKDRHVQRILGFSDFFYFTATTITGDPSTLLGLLSLFPPTPAQHSTLDVAFPVNAAAFHILPFLFSWFPILDPLTICTLIQRVHDSSEIIYTPFLCGRNVTISTPTQCSGGWLTRQVGGNTSVSTTGPNATAGEVIPQMFFQFRGSALYLNTTEASNAQANITVTTNGTTISAVFDSRLGSASILNLVSSTVTTFALTFMPSNGTTSLELTSLILTVPNGTLTTTLPILPSLTLPPSSSPPIFTPAPTPTSTFPTSSLSPVSTPQSNPSSHSDSESSSHRSNVALAVGLTVGLGLGLTSVTVLGYWWHRKRRRSNTGRVGSPEITSTNQNQNNNFNGGSGRPGIASQTDAHATGNLGRIDVGRFSGSGPGVAGAGRGFPVALRSGGRAGGGDIGNDGLSPRLASVPEWRDTHG